MLSNLTPSVELTGGPWYSDGGLDQSFIDGLLGACLMHVKKQASFDTGCMAKHQDDLSTRLGF